MMKAQSPPRSRTKIQAAYSVLVLAFASLMFVACGPNPEPPSTRGCISDDDCLSSHYCDFRGGKGSTEPAHPTDDKASGMSTKEAAMPPVRGQCKPRPTKKVCKSDSECPRGYLCDSNQCKPAPKRKSCRSSRSCGSGEYCKFNGTRKADGTYAAPERCYSGGSTGSGADRKAMPARCQPVGQCVKKPKKKTCYSNRNCASDEYCRVDRPVEPQRRDPEEEDEAKTQPSDKGAPAARHRPTGQCVKKPKKKTCYSDRNCARGEYCNLADAPAKPEQRDPDEDEARTEPGSKGAPPARRRRAGQCVKRPRKTCQSDRNCRRDEYCAMTGASSKPGKGTEEDEARTMPRPEGICVKRRPKNRCKTNRDCEPDQECKEVGVTSKCGGSTGGGSTAPAPEGRDAAPKCGQSSKIKMCVKKQPKPSSCRSSRDCEPNEECRKVSECGAEKPSNGDRAMPPKCQVRGICVKKSPKTRKCKSNRDCKVNEKCTEIKMKTNCAQKPGGTSRPCAPPRSIWICKEVPELPRHCSSSRDCRKGERCRMIGTPEPGNTTPAPKRMPAPPRRGICVKDTPPKPGSCQSDRDCDRSQECRKVSECGAEKPSNGDRAMPPKCRTRGICVKRRPKPRTCRSHRDCRGNEKCTEIQAGTTCVKKPGGRPGSCAPPKSVWICKEVPKPPVRYCSTSRDCRKGERCVAKGTPPPSPAPGSENDPAPKRMPAPPPRGTCQ